MRLRHRAKVHHRHELKDKYGFIYGYLQLVTYFCGNAIPHIEYSINIGQQKKGLMSRELPKYLKFLKKCEQYKLIAVVDDDNLASKKLLERNGFIYFGMISGKCSYLQDMRFTKKEMEAAMLHAVYHERSEANRRKFFNEQWENNPC